MDSLTYPSRGLSARPSQWAYSEDSYDPQRDNKPQVLRAGANDAFKCPSLMGDTEVPYWGNTEN